MCVGVVRNGMSTVTAGAVNMINVTVLLKSTLIHQ